MIRIESKKTQIFLYAAAMAALLFVLKWLEFRLLIINNAFELYIGAIALLFTIFGIWVAGRITRKTTLLPPHVHPDPQPDLNEILSKYNISKRELEVLMLIAKGHTNQEIAAHLFVSLSTIKSHVARLFEKLEVNRRTQALEKAKQIGLLR